MRTYHVLLAEAVGDPEGSFVYLTEIEAGSAEAAIRQAAADNGTGRYAAVPDRSWTVINARVEIPEPRVILETETEEVPAAGTETPSAPDTARTTAGKPMPNARNVDDLADFDTVAVDDPFQDESAPMEGESPFEFDDSAPAKTK